MENIEWFDNFIHQDLIGKQNAINFDIIALILLAIISTSIDIIAY